MYIFWTSPNTFCLMSLDWYEIKRQMTLVLLTFAFDPSSVLAWIEMEGRKTSWNCLSKTSFYFCQEHSEPEFEANCMWAVVHAQMENWSWRFLMNGSSCSSVSCNITWAMTRGPLATIHNWMNSFKSFTQHFTFSCHGNKSKWGMCTPSLCLVEDNSINIYKNVLSKYLQWDNNKDLLSLFSL